ncbi:unannotated protein [freshwater metagenome]|uniref:Unannotated protein n=1 Tax=freshwater metagenome TaxID=449393 RepID=A0A6J7I2N1_9ZZZZ|nr:alpha/beta fold hydrolase [Actinomycetota bacterium]
MDTPVLHVVDAGSGLPLVLLHGLTATHRYVVMGSRALERADHRVIAFDARGHGASAPAALPEDYGYDALTADLLRVLDDCGVDRAVLVGASMGAHTALRAALERPERVAGLVVITPAFDERSHLDPAVLARWDALSAGLRAGGVDEFVHAYGPPAGDTRWAETIERVLRQRLSAHEHPDAVADALMHVPRSAPFAAIAELEQIAVPTLVVGDQDDPDPGHPLAVAQAYAAAIPGAQLVVEEPGASPIPWQGGQLSALIAELAARAAWNG